MADWAPPAASAAPPHQAGWYPDPHGSGELRYHDGWSWTAHVAGPVVGGRALHPTFPLPAAIGGLVILVVSIVGGRFLIEALVRFEWPIAAYVALLAVVGYGPSVAWCRYSSRRWGTGSMRRDFGISWRWIDAGWAPLIWLGALGCQVVVALVVLATRIPITSNTEGVKELDADRGYVIALLVTAVCAAPIVEELVFRGLVLRGLLSRYAAVPTIASQAVLFGVAHVDPVRGAGNIGLSLVLSGVGAAFGAAAFWLRRIGPTMIAHAIFNGVVLTIVLTGVLDDLQQDTRARTAVLAPVRASTADDAVVDQADVTEPGGDGDERPVLDLDERSQRVGVDDGDVLELGAWLASHGRLHGGGQPGG
jgi:hypothetical protein